MACAHSHEGCRLVINSHSRTLTPASPVHYYSALYSTKLLAIMATVGASLTGVAKVEVVVVDDCSTDGSGAFAAKLAAKLSGPNLSIEVVRTPSQFGTARAKNFGQRHTTSPITITLDAHVVPKRGALELMAEPLTRDDNYMGLNHLPSGRFAANAAWMAVQVMAHNLARWTARIGLGEQVVTTKTLRRRFFSLAGRITRSARRLTLHLPQRWPWETQFDRALARLRALPLPA